MSGRLILKSILSLCAIGALSIAAVFLLSLPPTDMKPNTIVAIPKGATLSVAGDALVQAHIIRSEFAFKIFVALFGGRNGIKAGSYNFTDAQSVIRVARRVVTGDQQLVPIKVTIPEGLDSSAIAAILFKKIPGFDAPYFLSLAKPQEGYLFPDTYFFFSNTTPEDVISAMKANFFARTAEIAFPVMFFEASANVSASDVLKMASIVEKEATSTYDRQIVASILWKRIKAGMPLQVDPPFAYFLGKDTSKLTLDDLKIDSPYNLYLHKGLPPTPIDNPGINSIIPTVLATSTAYWFYLSDAHGGMHYATNLQGHIANRQKYLGK